MTDKNYDGRRSFLKKAATTTALTGGTFASVEPVAAVTQEIEVEITSNRGRAYYTIQVSDPNASAKSTDSEDSVTNYSDHSVLEGELNADDGDLKDTYEMSGHITYAEIDGHVDVTVWDPYAYNGSRDMEIYGTDADYVVQINGTSIESDSDIEPSDSTDSNSAQGTVYDADTDYYVTEGATIEWISVECEERMYISHPV